MSDPLQDERHTGSNCESSSLYMANFCMNSAFGMGASGSEQPPDLLRNLQGMDQPATLSKNSDATFVPSGQYASVRGFVSPQIDSLEECNVPSRCDVELLSVLPDSAVGNVQQNNDRNWEHASQSFGEAMSPFASSSLLASDAELLQNTTRPKHVCKECGKVFKRAHNLKIHGRLHSGDKPYKCPFGHCNKEFRWKSSIVSHLTWHRTKRGEYLPSDCGELTSSAHKAQYKLRRGASNGIEINNRLLMTATKNTPHVLQEKPITEEPLTLNEHMLACVGDLPLLRANLDVAFDQRTRQASHVPELTPPFTSTYAVPEHSPAVQNEPVRNTSETQQGLTNIVNQLSEPNMQEILRCWMETYPAQSMKDSGCARDDFQTENTLPIHTPSTTVGSTQPSPPGQDCHDISLRVPQFPAKNGIDDVPAFEDLEPDEYRRVLFDDAQPSAVVHNTLADGSSSRMSTFLKQEDGIDEELMAPVCSQIPLYKGSSYHRKL